MFSTKRLSKELIKLRQSLAPGLTLVQAEDFKEWLVDVRVVDGNPLYLGQVFRLRFTFNDKYPIEAPEVVFIKTETHTIPMHPHVYSNGIICLDLLDKQGWSPVHNVESVCVSLQSMLTSNDKRERPPGDEQFVQYNKQKPRDLNFVFHDDKV